MQAGHDNLGRSSDDSEGGGLLLIPGKYCFSTHSRYFSGKYFDMNIRYPCVALETPVQINEVELAS